MEEIKTAVATLRERLDLQQALLTLSEQGVYIDAGKEQYHFPAHIRMIADVSGAGDTVVSVAALALALGLSSALMASLANLAGGLVCEHIGVVPITKADLLAEAKENLLHLL